MVKRHSLKNKKTMRRRLTKRGGFNTPQGSPTGSPKGTHSVATKPRVRALAPDSKELDPYPKHGINGLHHGTRHPDGTITYEIKGGSRKKRGH